MIHGAQPDTESARVRGTLLYLVVCETCSGRKQTCSCLWDIKDPSAFVHATINKSRILLGIDEREELHAEGLAILHRLAATFEPHRAGYAQAGRFSGYAAQMLARKLGDAWHSLHPEHSLRGDPDTGKRVWHYGEKPVSLEALVAGDPDRTDLLAEKSQRADLKTRLHSALMEKMIEKVKMITEVGEALSEGATPADIQKMLGLTAEQVKDAMNEIAPVIAKLRSEGGDE